MNKNSEKEIVEMEIEKENKPNELEKAENTHTVKSFFFQIVDISLRLFIITVVVVLLLAVVNNFTAPIITANSDNVEKKTMSEIFEKGAFIDITDKIKKDANPLIVSVNEVKTNNKFSGYCVKSVPKGYGGEISMLCGIDENGAIVSVSVMSASETPGIGTKVITKENLDNYKGYKLGEAVESSDNDVKIISGATITSKAVYSGIKCSIIAINPLLKK